MAIADKMWDAIASVIKMNDKIEQLGSAAKSQHDKISNLTERVIRLETIIELGMGGFPPLALRIDQEK